MVLELNAENYKQEVEESDIPVIVDFWAEGCGPCKMMAPVFDELSTEYEGRLKFVKLSTEHHPNLASANDVSGIPCLVIFNEGEEVDRIVGFNPKPQLKQKIDEIMGKI